jgi:hypothetical protein
MDLKPYYDKVLSLQAETQGVVQKIENALSLGTAEGEETALSMQGELEAAIEKQEKAESFYNTLLAGSKTATNPVMNFLPVEQTEIDKEAESPKVMKRTDWDALPHNERAAFIQGGGVLEN